MRYAKLLLAYTVAVILSAFLVPGIYVEGMGTAIVIALALGLLKAFVRPLWKLGVACLITILVLDFAMDGLTTANFMAVLLYSAVLTGLGWLSEVLLDRLDPVEKRATPPADVDVHAPAAGTATPLHSHAGASVAGNLASPKADRPLEVSAPSRPVVEEGTSAEASSFQISTPTAAPAAAVFAEASSFALSNPGQSHPPGNPSNASGTGSQAGSSGSGVTSHVFTDVEPLGQQGAMSYVQKARYDRQWVVVKRLLPQHRNNPMYKELFFKEYHNARDLSHEHIVDVQSRGEDAEGPYFFMEYVDGQSLSRLLLPAGIRDEKFIRRVTTQTLEALQYAHKKQVFHRDLKPDNILITNRGDNVKLIDFGLAAADKFEDLAGAGFIGTKKYAAPEQSLDPSRVDGRADLYAFGLILLEMGTGSTDPAQLDRMPSVALRNIAAKCLEKNPARRYADAGDVLEDLRAAPKQDARQAEPAAVPEGFRLLMNEFVLEWLPSDMPLPGQTVKLIQKQAASAGLPGAGLETELLDLRDLYRQVVSSGRVTPFARRSLLVQGQLLHVSETTIDQLLGQAVPPHGQNRPVPD